MLTRLHFLPEHIEERDECGIKGLLAPVCESDAGVLFLFKIRRQTEHSKQNEEK